MPQEFSWRYYYQDNSVYLAEWGTWARDSGKVRNISNYYTDIQNEATLPKVIFIERASDLELDEHPTKNVQLGSKNTKKIIDALMASNSWGSSAFILTFDEGGGLYDHVVPPAVVKPDGIAPILKSTDRVAEFNQMGFRVPLEWLSAVGEGGTLRLTYTDGVWIDPETDRETLLGGELDAA